MQSLEVGWEAPLEQGRSTRCDQLGVKFKYMQMLSSSINLPMRTLGGLCHPLQSLQMLVKLRFSYSDVIYMLFLKKHVGFFFLHFFFFPQVGCVKQIKSPSAIRTNWVIWFHAFLRHCVFLLRCLSAALWGAVTNPKLMQVRKEKLLAGPVPRSVTVPKILLCPKSWWCSSSGSGQTHTLLYITETWLHFPFGKVIA